MLEVAEIVVGRAYEEDEREGANAFEWARLFSVFAVLQQLGIW